MTRQDKTDGAQSRTTSLFRRWHAVDRVASLRTCRRCQRGRAPLRPKTRTKRGVHIQEAVSSVLQWPEPAVRDCVWLTVHGWTMQLRGVRMRSALRIVPALSTVLLSRTCSDTADSGNADSGNANASAIGELQGRVVLVMHGARHVLEPGFMQMYDI